MSKDGETLLFGLLLVLVSGIQLARTYRTDSAYNVMKRAAPRVRREDDPGLFWFSAAVMAGFFLLGVYLAATTRIASTYLATLR